jgi:hypothetical protein
MLQTAVRFMSFIYASLSGLRNAVALPKASAAEKVISHCRAKVCELTLFEALAGGKPGNVDVLTCVDIPTLWRGSFLASIPLQPAKVGLAPPWHLET